MVFFLVFSPIVGCMIHALLSLCRSARFSDCEPQLSPESGRDWATLGNALYQRDAAAEAADCFERAVRLDGHVEHHVQVGEAGVVVGWVAWIFRVFFCVEIACSIFVGMVPFEFRSCDGFFRVFSAKSLGSSPVLLAGFLFEFCRCDVFCRFVSILLVALGSLY